MPVRKVGRKYAIGKGKPVYKTKKSANEAMRAYYAKIGKRGKSGK